eukprot:TRINITY_DN1146_c0_g2_i6.p1 TRINITY_DN1146_c0_g2~~TRINITY_DN1146_c0_g2_i6.p1  ORF type:complete len:283 (+),score=61.86 TRINITY_DN1146_c0_g2_i6:94-942(+)
MIGQQTLTSEPLIGQPLMVPPMMGQPLMGPVMGPPMMGPPMMGPPMMGPPMMGPPMMGPPMMGPPMTGPPMTSQPMVQPKVIAKTVLLPVSVTMTPDEHGYVYHINISVEELFPDGSKAEHKHQCSGTYDDLKKVHDTIHHGGLVKHESELHFPSASLNPFASKKESEKKATERSAQFKTYFDEILKSPKVTSDTTFLASIHCDTQFEIYLKRASDYAKIHKKALKKQQKIGQKAEKKAEKEEKKAKKHAKKEGNYHEDAYHQAVKQQVYNDIQAQTAHQFS